MIKYHEAPQRSMTKDWKRPLGTARGCKELQRTAKEHNEDRKVPQQTAKDHNDLRLQAAITPKRYKSTKTHDQIGPLWVYLKSTQTHPLACAVYGEHPPPKNTRPILTDWVAWAVVIRMNNDVCMYVCIFRAGVQPTLDPYAEAFWTWTWCVSGSKSSNWP